ncbi:hypothetical protein ACFQQB_53230 [Nonomuraea rubra]|uniref:hypothetical protein n=1 Tax=Nonomuraea rubra TaxID=46180 RepID=UPI003615CBE2
MSEHAISPQTGILGDAYACGCGVILGGRMAAELHAAENGLCSACLGSTEEQVAPGLRRPATPAWAAGGAGSRSPGSWRTPRPST